MADSIEAGDQHAAIEVDVLVVGAGPCGILLANLLGTYGTPTLVIDREPDVVDYPRAVGIDDESLRSCQSIGLVDPVLADVLQDMPIRYYTSWGRCFAHVQPSARPFGWPRRNLFLQPMLERTLRDGVSRFDTVVLRLGHELVSLAQYADHVEARITSAAGDVFVVRAGYVVGADGGRSTVRDLVGVVLEGTTEPVKWLVVDVGNDLLDAPYAAVYCDVDSPTLMVPLPYGHRRFEFRLSNGEDERAVVAPEHVHELLQPRYASAPLPDVVRARVYLHHSRVASTFGVGRVLLAGDAAHLQPPFFGQGMNSGMRDATNLAWKLAAVARGIAGPELMSTYDAERRPHAARMVEFATRIGALYRPRNRVTERLRDLLFRGVQLVPGGRDYILQMRYKPMPRYTQGVVSGVDTSQKNDPVGRMFPQPNVETIDGRVLLDDAIGPWFAVLGLAADPTQLDGESLDWWRSIGARVFGPAELGDVDGELARWRDAQPGIDVVVLRPDRYVAIACARAEFATATADIRRALGATNGMESNHEL